MMKIKKMAALLLTAVMGFSLAGCNAITIDGEEGSITEGGSGGNGSIGFSVSTLNNPFFVTLSEGAEAKAEEEGADLIVVDAGDDAAKQTSDIEDLISRTGEDMMKVRNMGRKSLEEVQNKLAMMGLSLASDDSSN